MMYDGMTQVRPTWVFGYLIGRGWRTFEYIGHARAIPSSLRVLSYMYFVRLGEKCANAYCAGQRPDTDPCPCVGSVIIDAMRHSEPSAVLANSRTLFITRGAPLLGLVEPSAKVELH